MDTWARERKRRPVGNRRAEVFRRAADEERVALEESLPIEEPARCRIRVWRQPPGEVTMMQRL